MLPFPALLPAQAAPRPGAIPHLAADELAVVSEGGGHMAYEGRLAVRTDGTVTYVSSMRGKPEKRLRWRLTRGELGALRLLIARADFPALHAAPRAPYAPSMADGLDRGLAVRQKKTVRGWTNTVWTEPQPSVPLLVRLADLVARSRALGGGETPPPPAHRAKGRAPGLRRATFAKRRPATSLARTGAL